MTARGPRASQTAKPRINNVPPKVNGLRLSKARDILKTNGWTVKTRGTRNRSIRVADESTWQVTKLNVGKKRMVILTAGKLSNRTVQIAYKTKKKKLADESTTYRHLVQRGKNGKRTITYLDGKQIKSKVTKKPIKRIIAVGTVPNYTGRCTIWGSYANRYVRCTGFYNPAAKRAAKELAAECNSTTWPLAVCRDVYGTYFY